MQDLTQTHEAEVANLMVEREQLAQQVSHKESVFDVPCYWYLHLVLSIVIPYA